MYRLGLMFFLIVTSCIIGCTSIFRLTHSDKKYITTKQNVFEYINAGQTEKSELSTLNITIYDRFTAKAGINSFYFKDIITGAEQEFATDFDGYLSIQIIPGFYEVSVSPSKRRMGTIIIRKYMNYILFIGVGGSELY